jgi:eukaryotic-like serine/threonine-protein kinase
MTQPRLLGGRYELDGVIGRGGMAEVYRARDLRLDRIVAIKTLRTDLARDPTFQARFRREAQSAASLNHPSVIAVYDTGEDLLNGNPVPYIVMEYAEGKTLRDVLREEGRLRPERAMEMVDGILRALDYSHRGGIVHRDIKPANVMLTTGGEIKVMDFGIARAMADTAATMTQTAQVIGTAQYLSPEQARGERVDARSDIYSTGCVAYELMTGRPPFQGDSPVAIAYQHVREEPIPLTQLDPQIPQWADAITMKALAKDPNLRYQSATEMRADIQRALQGMPVAAPTMAMNAGTQVLQGGPGTQSTRVATGYDLPPAQYEEPEKPDGNGKKIALWTVLALVVIGAAVGIGLLLSSGGGGSSAGDTVAVPAGIVGSTTAAAKTSLTQAGIPAANITTKEDYNDAPKGQVYQVTPNEGQPVNKKTGQVVLSVSKGQELVAVPSEAGKSAGDATSDLESLGFKVTTVQKQSGTVPNGNVISTDPKHGTKVDKGSTVTLNVSSGQSMTNVPNVVGEMESDAKNSLHDANLKVRVITQVTSDPSQQPGTVIAQTLNGQSVATGTTVTITVAKAPPTQPSSAPPTNPSFP